MNDTQRFIDYIKTEEVYMDIAKVIEIKCGMSDCET